MYRKIEELEIYQLSEKLSDTVLDICANIAEDHGRYSRKENIQFCYFARGSLGETRNWLRRSINRELNAYINSLKNQLKESQ